MNIKACGEEGGCNIHVDTPEKWLLFKSLDALLSSDASDDYEKNLIKGMMDKFRSSDESPAKQLDESKDGGELEGSGIQEAVETRKNLLGAIQDKML